MAQPLFPSSLTCWHSEPTSSVFRVNHHAQWKETTGWCQDQHSPVKSLDDKQRCFKNKTYIKININSGYGSRKWEVTDVKASQDLLTSTCQSSQTYRPCHCWGQTAASAAAIRRPCAPAPPLHAQWPTESEGRQRSCVYRATIRKEEVTHTSYFGKAQNLCGILLSKSNYKNRLLFY